MTFFFKLQLFFYETNYISIESMKPVEYANVRLPIFSRHNYWVARYKQVSRY